MTENGIRRNYGGLDKHQALVYNRNCSIRVMVAISNLIQTMQWRGINIIYEETDEELVSTILNHIDMKHNDLQISVYDVTNMDLVRMQTILSTAYKNTKISVAFITILRNKTIDMLNIANGFDSHSNKTTNYRTNSYWILWSDIITTKHLYVGSMNFTLKNVIMLQCHADDLYFSSIEQRVQILEHPTNLNLEVFSKFNPGDLYPNSKYKLNGRHLFLGVLESPMLKIKANKDGTLTYGSFLFDLTEILASALNFTYTFVHPEKSVYGQKTDGEWDGLVGLLVNQEIDVIMADLTITEDRASVIDYIYPPFTRERIGILYKRGVKLESSWFKIFRPLHLYVYLCTIASVVFVGNLLLITDIDHSSSRIGKSMWTEINFRRISYIMITLLGFVSVRGDGIWPKQVSSRILIMFFWMFCLVLTGVYVGNLTAKLTDTSEKLPFSSLEELVKLSDWKWGIDGNSLYREVLMESSSNVFMKFWEKVVEFNKTDPIVLHSSKSVHIEKILSSDKYAIVVPYSQYIVYNRNDCALDAVGGVGLTGMSLAIATTKGSYLKPDLEKAMWNLYDYGFFKNSELLHTKDNRPEFCKQSETIRPLLLDDMLGSILIVSVGLGLAFVVLIVEIRKKHDQIVPQW
ncbi:hypothetical protein SNE40_003234 [Patella caerulea]